MMLISVLSGKGGTGKTTIAVNLAVLLGNSSYVDCDVEEPNGHIFLKPHFSQRKRVDTMIPAISEDKCTGCGKCADFCYFNALAVVKKKVILFPEICHGCGGCILACPHHAVTESKKYIGRIETGRRGNVQCVRGVLEIGQPVGVPIIREMKNGINGSSLTILDCPPGSSCAVVNSIQGTDYALLVTEPTNFGLHDLKIAVQLISKLGIPGGVVINRSGEDDVLIEEYCSMEGIPLLGKIPFEREIAEIYSRGDLLVDYPKYRKYFKEIAQKLGGVINDETACDNQR
jgi:MinD superfamily P-loop ATPase